MRLHRRFRRFEHGSAAELAAYRAEQLERVVGHAKAHSRFLSELYSGIDVGKNIRLEDLPIVDKRLMMEHFDEWMTDPRLTLLGIERQIETDEEEQFYLGEYRIVATSGSSGLRGIFVYDRAEWSVVVAAALRWAEMLGVSPFELGYKKLASVKADKLTHATSRLGQSVNLGMRNLMMIDATDPLEDIVAQLNEFRPDILMGYASMISLLAVEQVEGRLHITPEMVASFSEMLGEDRGERIKSAWGLKPFNHYGAAEQVTIAADCDAHAGLHHFADMSIVEVVDEDNRPVPIGTPGHKILLTNLHKFVQPVIRYEMTDLVTRAPHGCSCGRPFALFSHVGGRTEDIFVLRGEGGTEVFISPMLVFDCMIEHAEVIEYQYRLDAAVLTIRVVPRRSSDRTALGRALQDSVTAALVAQGARDFVVEITFVDQIARSGRTMGKLKLHASNS